MQYTPGGLFDSDFARPVLRVSFILSQRLSRFTGSAHAGVFFYEAMRSDPALGIFLLRRLLIIYYSILWTVYPR